MIWQFLHGEPCGPKAAISGLRGVRRPPRGPNLKSLHKLGLFVSNYEVTVAMHYERPPIDGIRVRDQGRAMSDRVGIGRLNHGQWIFSREYTGVPSKFLVKKIHRAVSIIFATSILRLPHRYTRYIIQTKKRHITCHEACG